MSVRKKSPVQAPGVQSVQGKDKPSMSHRAFRGLLESKPTPKNIFDPAAAKKKKGRKKSTKTLIAGFAANTIQGPASIVEQARALRNDPQLIFEFVANNIEFLPTFGLQKGALGALVDGMGNAFDQADLMVQLLREAGFTDADYMFGELDLSETEANNWFGTTTIWAARNLLLNGGDASADVIWTGTEYRLQFSHCWVIVGISGTDRVFDPAFKTYTSVSGINLATALSYNQTSFMSNATSGATVATDYVQDMNRSNIRSDLATMTDNLVDWINTNDPDASVTDILGGREIVAVSIPLLQTSLSYQKSGSTPTRWTSIPNGYKATFNVYFDGGSIDVTFYSADVYGKRLTFFYNGSHEAELRLDGTLQGTSSAQTPGGWNSVLLTATHPYGSSWADQSVWHRVWTDKSYVIANAWGNAGIEMANLHSRSMNANSLGGAGDSSESVLGEALSVMWYTWNTEKSRACDLLNRMTLCTTVLHHQVGLVGYNETTLTDLGMINWASSALDNDYDRVKWNDDALAMHGIAFESSLQKEMVAIGGVSTTPIIDIANSAGLKIYDGKSANWTSNVRPNLTNYDTAVLDDVESWYVDNGWRVVLPEDGLIDKNLWTGYAYYARSPWQGAIGIIGGGLKGGEGDQEVCSNPCGEEQVRRKLKGGVEHNEIPVYGPRESPNDNYLKNYPGPAKPPPTPTGGEPIDMRNGAYILKQMDLSIGNGSHPYSLSFERYYSSAKRLVNGPLGLGWNHSFQMRATVGSEGMVMLGLADPISAAAAIVEMFVSVELYKDLSRPHDKYVTTALMNQWLIDQMAENVVSISDGTSVSQFIKLPDDSFVPKLNSRGSIIKNMDGTFTCKKLDQTEFNFNSAGDIATIVYPAGMTVTFTYTSGKLTSVSNGIGRTLTISWTGDYISSVSDGTGRSVSFTVDGSKNLTQVTNPNSKTTTMVYDIPGRLTQVKYPANPSTAFLTNVYDSLDRVKAQKNALNQQWDYYFAGSRSQEVDPLGNEQTYYFNRFGSQTKAIDALDNETSWTYDGLNRAVEVVYPEGNKVQWTWNTKSLVTEERFIAKSGSGLSDIVHTFTHDSTWNKLKTAVDGLGRTTTWNYNGTTGSLSSIVYPDVNSQTPQVAFTYNARGQVETLTDPTGIVTKWNWNSTTEVLDSVVADYGTSPHLNLTTSFDYNSRGDVTSVTDPRGNETTFQTDVLRRITNRFDPSPFSYETQFTYTDNSLLASVKRETGDISNPWQTVSFAYTATDKLDTVTDPSSHVRSFDYDSMDRLWKVTDAASRVWEYGYDELSRISTVEDPATNVADTRTYTDNGRLASIEDANGNVTDFTYDGHDRSDRVTYADTTYEQNQSYDANGNILTFRTRSGSTIVNTFDELNRLKTKTPQSEPTVTYVYDLAGRLLSASKPVVSGDPGTGTFSLDYDSAGRFYLEEYPDSKSVEHVLDENGNATRTTYPDGSWYIDRVFDELNRLTDIKLNGATSSALEFQYDALSRRTKTVYENGCETDFEFELDNDLNSLLQTFVGSSVEFTLGYDSINRITSQAVSDALFMWHPASGGTVSYGTANDLNQYPTVGGASYSYNDNGCLTGDGTWTYGYTVENKLVSATKTGVSASFVYDPRMRQVQKQVGSTKSRYYYSGLQRLADYDGSGNMLDRYVYGLGLDEVLIKVASGGTKTYYHQNWQGSVIALTDASGAVTNRYQYNPFGESGGMSGTTHGFTGQRWDDETGLYFYKNRHYSPKLGRFLEPDPIGFGDGLNMYTYVGNNPMNMVDLLGRAGTPSPGGSPGGGGGGGGGGLPPFNTPPVNPNKSQPFSNKDVAIMDALNKIQNLSQVTGREYNGAVYRGPGNTYYYTYEQGGHDGARDNRQPGYDTVFHSHGTDVPDSSGVNVPSDTDVSNVKNKYHVPSYIVTPNGSQFRILPNPAGGDPIVEYRGPNGWAPYHGPVAGPGGSAVGGDPDTVLPYTPPFNAY